MAGDAQSSKCVFPELFSIRCLNPQFDSKSTIICLTSKLGWLLGVLIYESLWVGVNSVHLQTRKRK